MRIGLIGLGTIAPFFLTAIDDDPAIDLTAVCDLAEDKLAPWVEAGVKAFTDHAELLDSGIVDAVVITLPNHLHAEVACRALRGGVAVCCEKPMAVTVEEADRMVEAAEATGTVLFTAFHRRYNRHLVELARALPSDLAAIDRIVHRYHENIEEHTGGDAWYLDARRGGGGCVIDNGPNALDAVQRLVGDLTLVDATIGDVRGGVEFYAELDLRSRDGVEVRVQLDWALPTGERKELEVHLCDGTVLRADLLAGHPGFKSSLRHEYRGILTDFRAAVDQGRAYRDAGPGLVALVAETYRVARAKEGRLRTHSKDECAASVVKTLFHTRDDRGMTLSPWASRCLRVGEVHELVTTLDRPVVPGDRVDRVGFLGFAEFLSATVLERGDEVWVGGEERVGRVAGFDECHFPNHYNVLVEVDSLLTAGDLDLRPGDTLVFRRGGR